jgi:hypothetical protein
MSRQQSLIKATLPAFPAINCPKWTVINGRFHQSLGDSYVGVSALKDHLIEYLL